LQKKSVSINIGLSFTFSFAPEMPSKALHFAVAHAYRTYEPLSIDYH